MTSATLHTALPFANVDATRPRTLGVLMLETRFPRPVGDIGNPETFVFPVRHSVVRLATPVGGRSCVVLCVGQPQFGLFQLQLQLGYLVESRRAFTCEGVGGLLLRTEEAFDFGELALEFRRSFQDAVALIRERL